MLGWYHNLYRLPSKRRLIISSFANQYVVDRFTDSGGTALTAHVPTERGGSWDLREGTSFVITSNGLKVRHNSQAFQLLTWSEAPPSADYSVFGDLTVQNLGETRWTGLVARRQGATNTFYFVTQSAGGNLWELGKTIAGAETNLGSFAQTVVAGNTYQVELRLAGTSLEVYIDGVLRISASDGDISAAGFVGLSGGGGGAAASDTNRSLWDNFSVSWPAVSATEYQVDIPITSTFTVGLTRSISVTKAVASTCAVALSRAISVTKAISSTFTVGVTKSISVTKPIASTFTVGFLKAFVKVFDVNSTFTVGLQRAISVTKAISSTCAVGLSRHIGATKNISSTFSVGFVRSISKNINIASTFAVGFTAIRIFLVAVDIASTFVVGMVRNIGIVRNVDSSFVVALRRAITVTKSVSSTFVVNIVETFVVQHLINVTSTFIVDLLAIFQQASDIVRGSLRRPKGRTRE